MDENGICQKSESDTINKEEWMIAMIFTVALICGAIIIIIFAICKAIYNRMKLKHRATAQNNQSSNSQSAHRGRIGSDASRGSFNQDDSAIDSLNIAISDRHTNLNQRLDTPPPIIELTLNKKMSEEIVLTKGQDGALTQDNTPLYPKRRAQRVETIVQGEVPTTTPGRSRRQSNSQNVAQPEPEISLQNSIKPEVEDKLQIEDPEGESHQIGQ